MRTIEVWQATLTQPAGVFERLEALLSGDERERAARMKAAERWVVARAALRVVLGARLDVPAGAVEFAVGPHGKPEVPGSPVRFNLAHSGELALIALADELEVGIDVERTSRRSHAVERTLTAGERAALDSADRHVGLLRVWCRKEAMAKAGGGGLGWAPETFDTTQPGEISLADVPVDDGYVASLAVCGALARVVTRRVVF